MTSPTTSERAAGVAVPTAPRATVIRVEDVAVRYTVPRERLLSFKEFVIRYLQGRVEYESFHALDGVTFDVGAGEVVGIIGRNGAGKSTLLKVISRVLRPTRGRVWRQGRVAPLLQLGAGFHSELTGRENIYLNGALLGYTKAELNDLYDEIVTFADIGPFIDAPLRTFSSGMVTRLGFAVATATPPDILLVDEALSVGDAEFQAKCTERLAGFRADGTTVLLVTHSIDLVQRLCNRVVWLDRGHLRAIGPTRAIIDAYAAAAGAP